MKLSQDKITGLISIIISAIIAILALFGYDVRVVQPRVESLQTAPLREGVVADRYFESLSVGKELRNAGTLTQTGPATLAANLAANGGLTVDGSNFAVNGATGAVSTASTIYAAGDVTVAADATGGNAGAKTEIAGLPRVKLIALGTMTNGATETTSYTDDSSTGEWAPIDGDVTEAEGSTDGIYRIGSSSYKASFAATAAAGDGFKRTITSDDLQNNESVGMWLYPSNAIVAGDLNLLLTDDGGARTITNTVGLDASKWNWLEFNVSSLDGTTGNAITEVGITLTTQGATNLAAFSLYMDGAWKWDASDEEASSTAILQDGVLSVLTIATAAGSPNTAAALVENTDFFIHYENGVDFLVTVTDQSANSGLGFVAY